MAAFFRKIRSIVSYAGILLFSKGATLLLSYYLALNVSSADFGYYSLAQAVLLASIALFGFNISAAQIRFFFEFGPGQVFRATRGISIFLFLAAMLSGGAVYAYFSEHPYYVWFSVLPVCGFLTAHLIGFGAIFRCADNVKGYAITEAGRPFLIWVFFVVLAYFLAIGWAVVYIFASLGSLLLLCLFGFFLLKKKGWHRARGQVLNSRVVFGFLFPLFFVQLMSMINNVGDRYLLAIFLNVEDVGRYSKAYLIGSSIGMLFDSMSLLWSPYVTRQIKTLHIHLRYLLASFFAIFGASVILFLVAIFIYLKHIDLFVDSLYLSVGVIVVSAFVVRVGYQIFNPILCAADKTPLVARISIIGGVTGVVANFLLIPWLGVLGAAVATWISFAVFSVLSVLSTLRLFNFSLASFLKKI